MNKFSLRIQVILTYATIITAALICLFALGFMSSFYTLFMNGNDEMYTFFKDLQAMNTTLFSSGLIFLIMSFLLITFDINKKTAGFFGATYTLILVITNIINGTSIFIINNSFRSRYELIDYTILDGYQASALPFTLAGTLFSLAIGLSFILFALTTGNYLSTRKKEKKSEK